MNSKMKSSSFILVALFAFPCSVPADGFSVVGNRASSFAMYATMAESGIPPATSDPSPKVEDTVIPTNLPSEKGVDYVPLATMLATGQLAEADQVTNKIRKKLIRFGLFAGTVFC